MQDGLKPFFTPSGVAIIGASSNPGKLSHGILRNMTLFGYKGKIYPVNPGSNEILGLQCYPEISKVPDPVELAVIILPAQTIPEVIKACGKRGIKATIIISGGFREVGQQGLALEKEVLKITQDIGMRMIGPNCVGTMNLSNGLDTTFIKDMPSRGGIGFLSQSGAVCGGVVDHIVRKNVGFSHFISLGNEADVNETDIIEFLGEDAETRVIAAYVESIQDGQRFLQIGKKVSSKKPIVVLKAGRSEAGAKAVSSHTGSLAGSREAYSAAFKQAGMIEANSVEELLNIALILDYLPLPKDNRAAILTNAGGPAALLSDSLEENNIRLAELSQSTKQKLREKLTPAAQVDNPVDMLGGAEGKDYGFALEQVLMDPGVDLALPILVPQALVNPAEVAQAIAAESKKSSKPVTVCFMGTESVNEARQILHQNRIPMLDYPEKLGKPLGGLMQYSHRKIAKIETRGLINLNASKEKVRAYLNSKKDQKLFGERDARPVLQAYGFPVITGEFAASAPEAARIADRLGYPLVLKVVSVEILHKSEVKGIRINLQNETELQQAWDDMYTSLKKLKPDLELEGCLVEKMAPAGQEVIIGMKRDANFGPLLMFGLGGIYVELFRDVSFCVVPLTINDASEMIAETHAGVLLDGFRGQPVADKDAIVDCLLLMSQLACEFPEIAEIEINPLMVYEKGKGAQALDCRIFMK